MKVLLFPLYWLIGFFMAVGACCALGMAISSVIAILKIPLRPRNAFIAVGYLIGGAIAASLAWSGFLLAGWVGDRTDYTGEMGLLVGAVFPGVFALSIIPQFIVVALKQTSGVEV